MVPEHHNGITMAQKLAFSILFVAALSVAALAQSRHRVVVEQTTGGAAAYSSTLKNIENMIKAFGAEPVDVEIVCHGPGIDLVFSHDNQLATRIRALQKQGVKFAACANTLKSRNIKPDRIFSFVTVVDAGTAEVVRKQEAGWAYLKR